MKKLIVFIGLLLLICQNINAQYTFLKFGDKSPYDSAIAVRIDVYRSIRSKVKNAENLINQANNQMDLLQRENDLLHAKIDKLERINKIVIDENKQIRETQERINERLTNIEDLSKPTIEEKLLNYGVPLLAIIILIKVL